MDFSLERGGRNKVFRPKYLPFNFFFKLQCLEMLGIFLKIFKLCPGRRQDMVEIAYLDE